MTAESRDGRAFRRRLNLFPAYRGAGARVMYVAPDWHEVHVEIRLSRRNRNPMGAIFGGSLYTAVDPHYVLMLIRLLGPEYAVWDKTATIRFRRPARSTLRATFTLDDAELSEIRARVAADGKVERAYTVELVDADGVVNVSVEKVVHVSRRDS